MTFQVEENFSSQTNGAQTFRFTGLLDVVVDFNTAVGTIRLERRAVAGSGGWAKVKEWSDTSDEYTGVAECHAKDSEFRLICSAYTSGTINAFAVSSEVTSSRKDTV